MPPEFFYAWDAGFDLIAFVYPLVAVCRGGRFVRTTLYAWGLLILYALLVCGVLPAILGHYNKALENQLGDLHFEPPFIFAMLLMGWIYPLLASAVGYGCKYCWRRYLERQSPGA